MTQQDLADATGGLVTKQSVSKYERNRSQPSPAVLRKLAEAFGVKTADLFREPPARIAFEAYRKFARLGKRKQEEIESRIRERLEERLRVQDLLGELRGTDIPAKTWKVSLPEDAEAAAEELRRKWALGQAPIASITDVLEEHRIHVLALDVDDDFDGVSAFAYENDGGEDDGALLAAAVVCHQNCPGGRQRLSLAHELAHLVLDVDEEATPEGFDEEKAAYRMGAAFLAPAGPLLREVGRRRRSLQIQELLLLKRRYGMSVQALLFRLKDLEVISESQFRQWFIRIGKLGWRKEEPQPLAPEEPQWLRRSVLRAFSEELISQAEAERLLGEPIGEEEEAALARQRSFMNLPSEERRGVLRRQAQRLTSHYEENAEERQSAQGGDITEYG
jgi:Zn-dependent peptidase ImmA (M78 family)/transcriptional regulator with XRE-family HTH domain